MGCSNRAFTTYFKSTSYHPLFLFNRQRDCLAPKITTSQCTPLTGEDVLLREIERYKRPITTHFLTTQREIFPALRSAG